jgi:diacylglycerol kinase family enzyme
MKIEIGNNIYSEVSQVINPGATRLPESSKSRTNLENYFPEFAVMSIYTFSEYSKNISHLGTSIPKRSLVFVFSGDGVIGEVASASILYDLDLTIVPTFAGNKNDLANAVHSENIVDNIPYIVEHGRVEEVFPLEIDFDVPEVSKDQVKLEAKMYALQYFGSGVSGKVAEGTKHRKGKVVEAFRKTDRGRLVFDALAIVRGIIKARNIGVDIEGKKPTRRSEILFINGESMAGIVKTPIKITDKNVVHLEARNRLSASLKLGRAIIERTIDNSRVIDGELNYSYRVLEDTQVHIDGQAYFVPRKTQITVTRSSKSVKILITNSKS